jgi:hypothetical protein
VQPFYFCFDMNRNPPQVKMGFNVAKFLHVKLAPPPPPPSLPLAFEDVRAFSRPFCAFSLASFPQTCSSSYHT